MTAITTPNPPAVRPMTDHDLRLLEQAKAIPYREYWRIDDLIPLAETEEAAERLSWLRWENRDLMLETI